MSNKKPEPNSRNLATIQQLQNDIKALGFTPPQSTSVPILRRELKQAKRLAQQEEVSDFHAKQGQRIISLATDGYTPRMSRVPSFRGRKGRKKQKNTVLAMLSDTHYDEVISPAEVHVANAYTRAISIKRTNLYFHNLPKLAQNTDSFVEIDGLVLALAGDIASGIIHEDLRLTNEQTILETIFFSADRVISGIESIASEFRFIDVRCVVGNHGRVRQKWHSKRAVHENYDWAIYELIRRHFDKHPTVNVHVSPSLDTFFQIYSTRFCMTHGNQFRGGTGISRAYTMLMLGDARKRAQYAAAGIDYDWLILGHLHTLIFGQEGTFVVNGSMKGFDEHALSGNFGFEYPQQAFMLVDPDWGITQRSPIHLLSREERAAYREHAHVPVAFQR